MYILTDVKYLSCIVMDYEPSTDTLKVLMCPYCIIQFLKKKESFIVKFFKKVMITWSDNYNKFNLSYL